MTIPQLLAIPSPSASGQPADPAASVAPATTETPPASAAAPASDDPPADVTDDFGTDELGTEQPADETTADGPVAGPDLAALAASFSCPDYLPQSEPDPLAASWGSCMLDDQQVLLYGFADDQSAADYAASLESSGVTADQMVTGPGYLIWADAGPIATVKAALGAG
jgi:hypothetical protein